MTIEEIYLKAQEVEGLDGMTVNERLFESGLSNIFDTSRKKDKKLARVILQAIKVDESSIIKILGK